jgi:hypothetical protein
MIVDEPYKPFRLEEFEEYLRRHDELARKRAATVPPDKQHILDIIQEANAPIKIVNVANQFSREAGHHWDSRARKAALRLQAFRIIGGCVKESLIARHRRKWVVYLGFDHPRRREWLQKIEHTINNFPHPNL